MVEERAPSPGLISAADAAGRLGVSLQRIYALIKGGEIRGQRISGRWFVEDSDIERRLGISPSGGRRFSPERAWGLLMLADGQAAPWLDPVSRAKLRNVLAHRSLRDLRSRLVERGQPSAFRAHPSDVARIARDPAVIRTGASAATEVGLELIAPDDLDVYVPARAFDAVVRRYHLRPSRDPNVVLRRAPDVVASSVRDGVAPRSAIALDLLEDSDPRSREAGGRLLERLAR